MEVKFIDLNLYNVDVEYLKYLHDADPEVYFSDAGYDKKPFLGITVGIGAYTYFIPLTSSKKKHLRMKNVGDDYYLIYEFADAGKLSGNAVCREDKHNAGKVQHIISELSIYKMIPVPDGCFNKVNMDACADRFYSTILNTEYNFCKSHQDGILRRVKKIYEEQTDTGIERFRYCRFKRLEMACDSYAAANSKNQ